jgi:hypothetical protein
MPEAPQAQLAALQEENAVLRTTIQTAFDFHEKLRDVKETARTDTQARFYAETPFGQRFLEKNISMSPPGRPARSAGTDDP